MPSIAGTTIVLRLEGLALGLACVWLYYLSGQSWWFFALLILAPDLAILGYLAGPRIGAAAYNSVHSWVTVVVLFALLRFGFGASPLIESIPFVLGAHIGIDRALGYGLKHVTGFKDTHLGTMGKPT